MVPVSLQVENDNPCPRLNEGLFFHRSYSPVMLEDHRTVFIICLLQPLSYIYNFKRPKCISKYSALCNSQVLTRLLKSGATMTISCYIGIDLKYLFIIIIIIFSFSNVLGLFIHLIIYCVILCVSSLVQCLYHCAAICIRPDWMKNKIAEIGNNLNNVTHTH